MNCPECKTDEVYRDVWYFIYALDVMTPIPKTFPWHCKNGHEFESEKAGYETKASGL